MDAFLDGFAVVSQPENLLYCLIGVLIGMLIGVLPGLGPAATMAILLPIVVTVDPVAAVIMLAGIYYGAQYGGTITSVLLRLPGEASSVVTVFDGFALAKQGKAGTALGVAAIGSFVGATFSIILLSLSAPLVASWALDFGPAEYAALALLGVLLIATIGSGHPVKALIAACVGLLFATVGRDSFSNAQRFSFDSMQLADGTRLRRRRHGPLRRRRDPLQPGGAPRQGARARGRQQHLALPQGAQAGQPRHRARVGHRLLPRRPARWRRRDGLARGVRHREAHLEDSRALRPWRHRGRRGPGERQQRGRHLVLHPPAHPRHPRQRLDGDAVRGPARPRRSRPAPSCSRSAPTSSGAS